MADRNWLVGFTNDTGPVPYYLYDRARGGPGSSSTTGPNYRATSSPRWDPSRSLPGTARPSTGTPRSPSGRSHLPAVLNVHGGPSARDSWVFDPEAQWTANRGLSVQAMGRQDA